MCLDLIGAELGPEFLWQRARRSLRVIWISCRIWKAGRMPRLSRDGLADPFRTHPRPPDSGQDLVYCSSRHYICRVARRLRRGGWWRLGLGLSPLSFRVSSLSLGASSLLGIILVIYVPFLSLSVLLLYNKIVFSSSLVDAGRHCC